MHHFEGKNNVQFSNSRHVPILHTQRAHALLSSRTMRAVRFPLQVPVHFRHVGEPVWHQGTVENISCSGVLLRAEDFLQIQNKVELRVSLPNRAAGAERPAVACYGRVVRTVSPSAQQPCPGAAVSIEGYNFLSGDGGEITS